MVRFIIGQSLMMTSFKSKIYIPIWLDLLFEDFLEVGVVFKNLHSNMVRFII